MSVYGSDEGTATHSLDQTNHIFPLDEFHVNIIRMPQNYLLETWSSGKGFAELLQMRTFSGMKENAAEMKFERALRTYEDFALDKKSKRKAYQVRPLFYLIR